MGELPPGVDPRNLVVMPHTRERRRAEAWEALCAAAGRPWAAEIDPADRHGYAKLLTRLWARTAGFVIVEHDVVVPDVPMAELTGCDHDWCGRRIDCGRGPVGATLGVARFSAGLQRRFPDLMVRAAGRGLIGPPRVPWQALDGWVRHVMRSRGVVWHEHAPPAAHLHEYPADWV